MPTAEWLMFHGETFLKNKNSTGFVWLKSTFCFQEFIKGKDLEQVLETFKNLCEISTAWADQADFDFAENLRVFFHVFMDETSTYFH